MWTTNDTADKDDANADTQPGIWKCSDWYASSQSVAYQQAINWLFGVDRIKRNVFFVHLTLPAIMSKYGVQENENVSCVDVE